MDIRNLVRRAALALALSAPIPATAQDERPAGPVSYRVAEVDIDTSMLRLVPDESLPETIPLQGELLLDWTEYSGRMETEEGFPVTLETVRVGAPANVWLDPSGDVVWIVFLEP